MSDETGTGGGERTLPASRRRIRWVVVGVTVGFVLAAVVTVAILAGGSSTDPKSQPAANVSRHLWPAEYGGPVWITVAAPDAQQRTVTITWGPWQRKILHASAEPRTYVFEKNVTRDGETNVPVHVRVDPGARVRFGSGTPPVNGTDVNDGWQPKPGAESSE